MFPELVLQDVQNKPNFSEKSGRKFDFGDLSVSKEIKMAEIRHIPGSMGKENEKMDAIPNAGSETVCFNLPRRKSRGEGDFLSSANINKGSIRTYKKTLKSKVPNVSEIFQDKQLDSLLNTSNVRTYKKTAKQVTLIGSEKLIPCKQDGCLEVVNGFVLDTRNMKSYKKSEVNNGHDSSANPKINSATTLNMTTVRIFPRNPSYLTAIQETINNNATYLVDRSPNSLNTPLDNFSVNPIYERENIDISNFDDKDLIHSEKSWKRLNIIHLLGTDCDKDLSSLCQMEREGKLKLNFLHQAFESSSQCSEPYNSSSSGIGSLQYDNHRSESRNGNDSCNSLSNNSRSEKSLHSESLDVCDRCLSPLNFPDQSLHLANSLNDSSIPSYAFSSLQPFDKNRRSDAICFASQDFERSNSSGCCIPEKYDKFKESYKQNLMIVCNVCQSQLPLPHRLSLKLNYGMGIEFSYGSSKPHLCQHFGNSNIPEESIETNESYRLSEKMVGNFNLDQENFNNGFLAAETDGDVEKRHQWNVRFTDDEENFLPDDSRNGCGFKENAIDSAVRYSLQKYLNPHKIVNSEIRGDHFSAGSDELEDSKWNGLGNWETTGDFSQIYMVNATGADDDRNDETSTIGSSQFWHTSDDSSSSSDEWYYSEVETTEIVSHKAASLQDLNASSHFPTLIEDSRHWSLDVLPSQSFSETLVKNNHSNYKGYYEDITGNRAILERLLLDSDNGVCKLKRSSSANDVLCSPNSSCNNIKCLCNCCLEVSSILWPQSQIGINSTNNQSLKCDRMKCALVGDGIQNLDFEGKSLNNMEYFNKNKNSICLHSTPQRPRFSTTVGTNNSEFCNSESFSTEEELSKYFKDVNPNENYCFDRNERQHPQFTEDNSFQFTKRSLQCCCWKVHCDWEQARNKKHECEFLDREQWKMLGRKTLKKYKAKEIIANKAQLHLSIYVNSGLITTHVIAGKKIYTKDLAVCNPFVKVSLFPEHPSVTPSQTSVARGTRNPHFDQKFSFEVMSVEMNKRIMLTLWHHDDEQQKNIFLGCMSFGIRSILSKKLICGWFRVLTHLVGHHKHFAVHSKNSSGSVSHKEDILPSTNNPSHTVIRPIHHYRESRLL